MSKSCCGYAKNSYDLLTYCVYRQPKSWLVNGKKANNLIDTDFIQGVKLKRLPFNAFVVPVTLRNTRHTS